MWIPAAFAHRFCMLAPDTEVIYSVTTFHAPECERGITFDDPDLRIDWPTAPSEAVFSDKDRRLPRFTPLPVYFGYP
jgi:dTDP-4-dehydrorhamnose 3,5-epimerase